MTRLRFSIRDLLWLTLVVAIAAGWWLDRTRVADKLERLRQRLEFYEADQGANRALVPPIPFQD